VREPVRKPLNRSSPRASIGDATSRADARRRAPGLDGHTRRRSRALASPRGSVEASSPGHAQRPRVLHGLASAAVGATTHGESQLRWRRPSGLLFVHVDLELSRNWHPCNPRVPVATLVLQPAQWRGERGRAERPLLVLPVCRARQPLVGGECRLAEDQGQCRSDVRQRGSRRVRRLHEEVPVRARARRSARLGWLRYGARGRRDVGLGLFDRSRESELWARRSAIPPARHSPHGRLLRQSSRRPRTACKVHHSPAKALAVGKHLGPRHSHPVRAVRARVFRERRRVLWGFAAEWLRGRRRGLALHVPQRADHGGSMPIPVRTGARWPSGSLFVRCDFAARGPRQLLRHEGGKSCSAISRTTSEGLRVGTHEARERRSRDISRQGNELRLTHR